MRLVVIIDDELPALIAKGEIIDRYYNPGNYFSEILIYVMNNKEIAHRDLQRTVGAAKLTIKYYNWSKWDFVFSIGLTPVILKYLMRKIIKDIKEFEPDCIRCHDNNVNSFIASCVKRMTGIPYVVSLHINRNEDIIGRSKNFKAKLINKLSKRVQQEGLENASLVLPVYRPILAYTSQFNIKNCFVSYNMINTGVKKIKLNYNLCNPVRLISVGRLIKEKNPINIIKAVAQLPNVELDIYGDGEIRDSLVDYVTQNALQDRVRLIPALSNDELISKMSAYDIFVVHTEYWEISKSILEALLTGLPVIINKRVGLPVPELNSEIVMLCENTKTSYLSAITELLENDERRASLGKAACNYAHANWSPEVTEKLFVEHYENLIAGVYEK